MHSEIHGHYPLPRRNTNEKLLPLELESDLRFMRAFKKKIASLLETKAGRNRV